MDKEEMWKKRLEELTEKEEKEEKERQEARARMEAIILRELAQWKEMLKEEVRKTILREVKPALKEGMKELLLAMKKSEKEKRQEEEEEKQRQTNANKEQIPKKETEKKQEEQQRKASTAKREQTNRTPRWSPKWKQHDGKNRQKADANNDKQEKRERSTDEEEEVRKRKIWYGRKRQMEKANKMKEQDKDHRKRMQQIHESLEAVLTEENDTTHKPTRGQTKRSVAFKKSLSPALSAASVPNQHIEFKDKLLENKARANTKTGPVTPLSAVSSARSVELALEKISKIPSTHSTSTSTSQGALDTVGITKDQPVLKPGDAVETSEATLSNTPNVSLSDELIEQVNQNDTGTAIASETSDTEPENVVQSSVAEVQDIVPAVEYPIIANVSHIFAEGFTNLLAIAAVTHIEFFEAANVKEYIKNTSKLDAAVAGTAATNSSLRRTAEEEDGKKHKQDGKKDKQDGKKDKEDGKKDKQDGKKDKKDGKKGEEDGKKDKEDKKKEEQERKMEEEFRKLEGPEYDDDDEDDSESRYYYCCPAMQMLMMD